VELFMENDLSGDFCGDGKLMTELGKQTCPQS